MLADAAGLGEHRPYQPGQEAALRRHPAVRRACSTAATTRRSTKRCEPVVPWGTSAGRGDAHAHGAGSRPGGLSGRGAGTRFRPRQFESFAGTCRRRSRRPDQRGWSTELNIIVRIPPVALHARFCYRAALCGRPKAGPRQHARGQGNLHSVCNLELSGWSLGMAIPAATVNRGACTFGLTATGVAVALALAIALAWFIEGAEAPIASLAKATCTPSGAASVCPCRALRRSMTRLAQSPQRSVGCDARARGPAARCVRRRRVGSWELRLGTKRLAWSREMEAIHGLAPATLRGFEAYAEGRDPSGRARVRSAMTDTQREEQYLEYRIVQADGAVRWVESRGKVVRDPSGAARGRCAWTSPSASKWNRP